MRDLTQFRLPGQRRGTAAGFCEFRRFVHYREWTYGEPYLPWGETPGGIQPTKRCPRCSRRLKLKANFCVGGEFVNWSIPEHKPRQTRKPGPKRQSKIAGRGK